MRLGPKTKGFLLGSLVDVSGFSVDVFKIRGFETHQIYPRKIDGWKMKCPLKNGSLFGNMLIFGGVKSQISNLPILKNSSLKRSSGKLNKVFAQVVSLQNGGWWIRTGHVKYGGFAFQACFGQNTNLCTPCS